MKTEFIEYLSSIGIPSGRLQNRIENIYNFYLDLLSADIQDIFVTDYLQDDGSRNYENLWFFSRNHCMEAKQFIKDDDFDIITMGKRIITWRIKKINYDFNNATSESRLNVVFILPHLRSGTLKASKENCDSLRDIFKKYIVPNLA